MTLWLAVRCTDTTDGWEWAVCTFPSLCVPFSCSCSCQRGRGHSVPHQDRRGAVPSDQRHRAGHRAMRGQATQLYEPVESQQLRERGRLHRRTRGINSCGISTRWDSSFRRMGHPSSHPSAPPPHRCELITSPPIPRRARISDAICLSFIPRTCLVGASWVMCRCVVYRFVVGMGTQHHPDIVSTIRMTRSASQPRRLQSRPRPSCCRPSTTPCRCR